MVNQLKPIAAAVVIFGAGAVTGSLIPGWIDSAMTPPPEARPVPGDTFSRSRNGLLDRMERELYLSAEQRRQVGEILHASQERTGRIWETISPQVMAEQQLAREQIRQTLTEDQRRSFDESFKMPLSGRRGPGGWFPRRDGFGRSLRKPSGNSHAETNASIQTFPNPSDQDGRTN